MAWLGRSLHISLPPSVRFCKLLDKIMFSGIFTLVLWMATISQGMVYRPDKLDMKIDLENDKFMTGSIMNGSPFDHVSPSNLFV